MLSFTIPAYLFECLMENIEAVLVLGYLPEKLKNRSYAYLKMIRYLGHLASGGERRIKNSLIAINIYTSLSAAFAKVKTKV